MFNHDDNQTDRSAESHLTQSEQKTKQLWRDSYSMNMALSGAMYRGVSPTGKLSWISPQEVIVKHIAYTPQYRHIRVHQEKLRHL